MEASLPIERFRLHPLRLLEAIPPQLLPVPLADDSATKIAIAINAALIAPALADRHRPNRHSARHPVARNRQQ